MLASVNAPARLAPLLRPAYGRLLPGRTNEVARRDRERASLIWSPSLLIVS
jgi:hypothetical protein